MNGRLNVLRLGLVVATVACATANAKAVELDPKSVTFRKQEDFKWRDPTHKALTNQTILQGNPNGTGLYININAGSTKRFSPPHYHPNDRFVMVIKGPWWVGGMEQAGPLTSAGDATRIVCHALRTTGALGRRKG